MLHAVVGLVLEPVARAAAAGTLRAAALDHEIGDHPVEVEAVVKAAPGQVDEVGDGQRCLFGGQFDADRAAVGVEGGDQGHVDSFGKYFAGTGSDGRPRGRL